MVLTDFLLKQEKTMLFKDSSREEKMLHIVAEGYEGAKKFPGQTNGGDI